MFSPKKFREIVVQILFCLEMGEGVEEELVPLLMKELKLTKKTVAEAYKEAFSIWEKREEIDLQIKTVSHAYEIDRIGKVEKNVLRYFFSLLTQDTFPRAILFAEAIRLTIKFCTEDAAAYVHAILEAYFPKTPITNDTDASISA